MKTKPVLTGLAAFLLLTSLIGIHRNDTRGQYPYDAFEKPGYCGSCHDGFYAQWSQTMMSEAYTHKWDEIEYFDLAVAHAAVDPAMKGVDDGCNGCHAPLAYAAGELPPPRPAMNSRANESVSCEVCHNITGFEGDIPFNHNYIMDPGKTKYTSRKGTVESPNHEIRTTDLHSKAEFCGTCHNEKNPYGIWVKSTHLELKEGPYYAEGVVCQDCHMPHTPGKTAKMGSLYENSRLHLLNGAHDEGKKRGTIELRIQPDRNEAMMGDPVTFTVTLFNQKTGHKFPTGSVEDRIVWLHVEAVDEDGNVYPLPVNKKGFEGEEYTIAGDDLAYQDLAIPLKLKNFNGLRREDVPAGDRIFRMPYFDPEGNMTIMQWNTKSLGVDYRLGPRETKTETYTFEIPYDIKPGKLTVHAVLNYRLLVKPVGEYLGVPESEYTAQVINEQVAGMNILP